MLHLQIGDPATDGAAAGKFDPMNDLAMAPRPRMETKRKTIYWDRTTQNVGFANVLAKGIWVRVRDRHFRS
jgi:hypothetical protein